MALLNGGDDAQIAFADELAADDLFMTVSSIARIANDFSESFKIIDVVVYVVTVMAAALAFAVVFTLSTTNISERERELATIKVLGFRRREVYRYINKETVILTLVVLWRVSRWDTPSRARLRSFCGCRRCTSTPLWSCPRTRSRPRCRCCSR